MTRLGREDSSFAFLAKRQGVSSDLALGDRRARAAALLVAALPGSLYIYQGDELGLDEVTDIPAERIEDPMYHRSGGTDPGRDGCRVPLPWSGDEPPFGFSPEIATDDPWLPQPAAWAALTVEAQAADPDSMLSLYRSMLAIRRAEPDLRGSDLRWLHTTSDVLAFRRGARFVCLTNVSARPVSLPAGASPLLASAPLVDGWLPVDATAWVRIPATSDSMGGGRG